MAIVAQFGGSAAGLLLLAAPDTYRALAPALAYTFAEAASAASPSGSDAEAEESAGSGSRTAGKSCSTAACMSRLVRDWIVARNGLGFNCCPKKRVDARGSGGGGGGADSGNWDANGSCCWLIIAPLIVELSD